MSRSRRSPVGSQLAYWTSGHDFPQISGKNAESKKNTIKIFSKINRISIVKLKRYFQHNITTSHPFWCGVNYNHIKYLHESWKKNAQMLHIIPSYIVIDFTQYKFIGRCYIVYILKSPHRHNTHYSTQQCNTWLITTLTNIRKILRSHIYMGSFIKLFYFLDLKQCVCVISKTFFICLKGQMIPYCVGHNIVEMSVTLL